jgi:hypothetical protein
VVLCSWELSGVRKLRAFKREIRVETRSFCTLARLRAPE